MIAPYGRVDPRDMCDTEGLAEGVAASLHPLLQREHGMGQEGTWGSWEQGLGPQHGEGKDWCCWGFSSERTRGPPQDVEGCHHTHHLGSSQLSAARNPQSPSSSHCAHTPLVTTMEFGTMFGETSETLLSITSPAPGSLSSPYLPREHFTPAPDAAVLFLFKKGVLI